MQHTYLHISLTWFQLSAVHDVVVALGIDVDLVIVVVVIDVVIDVGHNGDMERMFMAVARKVIWAMLTTAASVAVGRTLRKS